MAGGGIKGGITVGSTDELGYKGLDFVNPESLEVLPDARVEPSVASDNSNEVIQFERQGYFVRDKDSAPGKPVFNRTIGLRDTFAKEVGGKG